MALFNKETIADAGGAVASVTAMAGLFCSFALPIGGAITGGMWASSAVATVNSGLQVLATLGGVVGGAAIGVGAIFPGIALSIGIGIAVGGLTVLAGKAASKTVSFLKKPFKSLSKKNKAKPSPQIPKASSLDNKSVKNDFSSANKKDLKKKTFMDKKISKDKQGPKL